MRNHCWSWSAKFSQSDSSCYRTCPDPWLRQFGAVFRMKPRLKGSKWFSMLQLQSDPPHPVDIRLLPNFKLIFSFSPRQRPGSVSASTSSCQNPLRHCVIWATEKWTDWTRGPEQPCCISPLTHLLCDISVSLPNHRDIQVSVTGTFHPATHEMLRCERCELIPVMSQCCENVIPVSLQLYSSTKKLLP